MALHSIQLVQLPNATDYHPLCGTAPTDELIEPRLDVQHLTPQITIPGTVPNLGNVLIEPRLGTTHIPLVNS